LDAAEQQELYLLRRHFQISAHEALHELPAWELNLLLRSLAHELHQQAQAAQQAHGI
jgi:hypothetical protein